MAGAVLPGLSIVNALTYFFLSNLIKTLALIVKNYFKYKIKRKNDVLIFLIAIFSFLCFIATWRGKPAVACCIAEMLNCFK